MFFKAKVRLTVDKKGELMEEMEILLEEGDTNEGNYERFMVIGKIISGKILYRKGVMNILRNIWPIEVALMIREVGGICIVSVL